MASKKTKSITALSVFQGAAVLRKLNGGKDVVVIGIDVGNGFVKGFSSLGIEILLPNYFAYIDDENLVGQRGIDQGEFKGDSARKLEVFCSKTIDEEEYIWGEGVVGTEDPIDTLTALNRYATDEFKLLVEFALAKLVGDHDNVDVIVCTGVPSKEAKTASAQQIRAAFKGLHRVVHNGVEKCINVLGATVISQPEGTFWNLALDDQANAIEDLKIDGVKIGDVTELFLGVLDCGNLTVDLDAFNKTVINGNLRDTFTNGFGMDYYFGQLTNYINSKRAGGVPFQVHEVEHILRDNDVFIKGQVEVDCAQKKEEIIKAMSKSLISKIKRRWKDKDKFDKLFLVGGGAKFYKDYITDFDANFIVVPEPQKSNANGFYKFALLKAEGNLKKVLGIKE